MAHIFFEDLFGPLCTRLKKTMLAVPNTSAKEETFGRKNLSLVHIDINHE